MKATGIVRRIDDLGRIVIPKEIRRTLRIREGDLMGCVMLLMGEHDAAPTESEQTLAQTFAGFLGKQMES